MNGCRICGNNEGNRRWPTREMMFGTREPFDYLECGFCGCVQIAAIPDRIDAYYPNGYFAYQPQHRLARNRLRAFIDTRRVAYRLDGHGSIGALAERFAKPLAYLEWVRRCGTRRHHPILDVGCGAGRLLLKMRLAGFSDCTGIDPFLAGDIHYPNGVVIRRAQVADLDPEYAGCYALIMLHHSFEHVPDPGSTLSALARLLAPTGTLLVRIPVADCTAWERYRGNWVQLDPPRHLHLHTRASMELLAARAGLTVREVICDSTAFQFTGSEGYAQDVPLIQQRRCSRRMARKERRALAREVADLNASGRGDQAAFYLQLARPQCAPC